MNSPALTPTIAPSLEPKLTAPDRSIDNLYLQHNHWLVNWLTKKLDCPHNAFDLSQDTFMRIITKDNANSIEQPRAYLTTIAKGFIG